MIAERYKFYESKQERGESLTQYLAKLWKQAEHCNFGQFLEEALRERFVSCLESGTIKKALLVKKDLTLNTAVEIGVSCEMATEETFVISNKEIKEETFRMTKINNPCSSERKCYWCNDPSHLANRCRFKATVCNKCKMRGHIAVACRSGSRSDGQTYNNKMSPANEKRTGGKPLEQNSSSEDEDDGVHYIHRISGKLPYTIKLDLNNAEIPFQIDTSSGITIISESCYRMHLSDIPLKSSNVIIKTYSEEELDVVGKIYVDVRCNSKKYSHMKDLF